jgi:hypothetical protein
LPVSRIRPKSSSSAVREGHAFEALPRIGPLEQSAVLPDPAESLHQRAPDQVRPVVGDSGELVVRVGPHLGPVGDREESQGGEGAELEGARHPAGELRARRGVKDTLGVAAHPAVPEQGLQGGQVEQRRGIARDENAAGVNAGRAVSRGALADGEAAGVAGSVSRQVAGHARDVAIAAQDLVEYQRLAQPRERRSYPRRTGKAGDPAARRQPADQSHQ